MNTSLDTSTQEVCHPVTTTDRHTDVNARASNVYREGVQAVSERESHFEGRKHRFDYVAETRTKR